MSADHKGIVLQAENLCKHYGQLIAVNEVSFVVFKGEVLGFLGPNGAGKSTTIDLIATLQQPSNGQITYPGLGQHIQSHTIRQHIGIVPQELAIYGNLSVRDNLTYIGTMYDLKGRHLQERIATLLLEFGLVDKAKARARTLSGGQKRRLNFALADLHSPDLIVLDEPTVGLDPNARSMVWEIIQGYRQAGKTVLLTTHNMEEADALCDRIILIDQGSIVAEGTPADLKTSLADELILEYQTSELVPAKLLEEIKRKPGIRQASAENTSLRLVVQRQEADSLKNWLATTGISYTGLATQDVSLEDVFIHYTGRSLRGRNVDRLL
jgi:ABC-2 type transport system ATP-binding protein